MDPNDPKIIVDEICNLSAAKETVLLLGLLFLQTDSSFEMGIMDDIVQCWNNPRIKYFKIRHWNTTSRWRRSQFINRINQLHFLDPLHRFRWKLRTSTYLGLEPYLPANKGCWCRELVKVEIRNLQALLLVCPIILWRVSSTEDDWIFGWRSRLASQISILFWSFTFLRWRRTKRLLNCRTPLIQFLRVRNWWRCMWICKKTFPDISCVSQMLGGPSCESCRNRVCSRCLVKI